MSQFRLRTLMALPLLVACMFPASLAIRQYDANSLHHESEMLFSAVSQAVLCAFIAAAIWSTLEKRALLLRTTLAGVMCLCLTMAYVHAFPRLFHERNLLIRAVMIFLLLFASSLTLVWGAKGGVLLARRALKALKGPIEDQDGQPNSRSDSANSI